MESKASPPTKIPKYEQASAQETMPDEALTQRVLAIAREKFFAKISTDRLLALPPDKIKKIIENRQLDKHNVDAIVSMATAQQAALAGGASSAAPLFPPAGQTLAAQATGDSAKKGKGEQKGGAQSWPPFGAKARGPKPPAVPPPQTLRNTGAGGAAAADDASKTVTEEPRNVPTKRKAPSSSKGSEEKWGDDDWGPEDDWSDNKWAKQTETKVRAPQPKWRASAPEPPWNPPPSKLLQEKDSQEEAEGGVWGNDNQDTGEAKAEETPQDEEWPEVEEGDDLSLDDKALKEEAGKRLKQNNLTEKDEASIKAFVDKYAASDEGVQLGLRLLPIVKIRKFMETITEEKHKRILNQAGISAEKRSSHIMSVIAAEDSRAAHIVRRLQRSDQEAGTGDAEAKTPSEPVKTSSIGSGRAAASWSKKSEVLESQQSSVEKLQARGSVGEEVGHYRQSVHWSKSKDNSGADDGGGHWSKSNDGKREWSSSDSKREWSSNDSKREWSSNDSKRDWSSHQWSEHEGKTSHSRREDHSTKSRDEKPQNRDEKPRHRSRSHHRTGRRLVANAASVAARSTGRRSSSQAEKADGQNPLKDWLMGLDSSGDMLQYLVPLRREFASLAQISAALVDKPGGGTSVLSCIEPSFFQALHVESLGHRLILAKGIVALASKSDKG